MRFWLAIATLLLALPAGARDLGQWSHVDPKTREWFRGLTNSASQVCCDEADGQRVEDPNWRIESDGSYSVAINGQRTKVPPELLVKGGNRVGFAIVWLWPPYKPELRCFMPGTET
jgi:hypothetical protein